MNAAGGSDNPCCGSIIALGLRPELACWRFLPAAPIRVYVRMAGLVEYVAPVGEPLAAGETLVNLLRLDLYGSAQELTALSLPQDCVPILHFASASVHQGTELYKVMTNLFELPY